MSSISFELFLQEEEGHGAYVQDDAAYYDHKEALKIEFPAYRHYLYIPSRNANNNYDDERVTKLPTQSPTNDNDNDNNDTSISDFPSLAPSVRESTSTSIPSDEDDGGPQDPNYCNVNENGEINADPLADLSSVHYRYKIITDESSLPILESDILPFVEHKILEYAMKDIFQCNEEWGRVLSASADLEHRGSRRLGLVGASSNPADTISADESCTTGIEAESCSVVDGLMTLYTDGEGTDDERTGMAILICDALNSEDMKDSHEAILNLECIPTNPIGPAPIDTDNEAKTEIPGPQQFSNNYTTPMTIVGVMAALVIFFIVFAYRRHRPQDQDEEEGEFPVPDGFPIPMPANEQELDYAMNNLHEGEISSSGSISSHEIVNPVPSTIIAGYLTLEEHLDDEISIDHLPFPTDPLCMCVVDKDVD